MIGEAFGEVEVEGVGCGEGNKGSVACSLSVLPRGERERQNLENSSEEREILSGSVVHLLPIDLSFFPLAELSH